jgi:NHLM bacteriocin system ABC transporter ATP-binding protein
MLTDLKATTLELQDTASSASLTEICAGVGTISRVGGNKPFLLDDPESFWLVQTGRIEIFAVQLKAGQPTNARHYICSVLPGQAFFGVNSELYGEGLGLLAVAGVSTEIIKAPLAELHRLASDPQHAPAISKLVEDWVTALTTDLTSLTLASRNEILLEAGQQIELATRQKAGPKKGGVWVRFEEGQSLFLGEEELAPASVEVAFPLFGDSWFQALEDCRLVTGNTSDLIAAPGLWQGLELFYELFFRLKFSNIRLLTYDEINRLTKKAELDELARQESLSELASITGDLEAKQIANADLLLRACQLVGQAQGIAVRGLPEEEEPLPGTSPLFEIARASRMRLRKVSLEPEWWTKDHGPLLGFKQESSDPVALLPASSGKSYELVDPADNRRIRVTKTLAGELSEVAYVFYRPFPEKALSAWDLVKFGLEGTGNSLWAALGLAAAGGLLALLVPLITGYLFDTVILVGERSALWQILLGLTVVAFSGLAFQFTRALAVLRLETKMGNSLQAAIWDRLLRLPAAFFRDYSVGDLALRAMSVEQIRQLVGGNVLVGLLSSVFSLFSFFLLFTYNLGLALVALGLTTVTLLMIVGVSFWQLGYQRKLAEKQGKIAGLVLQLINGIAKLRTAGAETRAFRAWSKEFATQRKLAFKARQIGNVLTVFNAAWPALTMLAIFWMVANLQSSMSTGAFLAFLAAFTQFLTAMIGMATALTAILQAIPIYERSKVIFQAMPEVSSFKTDPGELSGAIEVNHLSFRYHPDAPYILNDVSLQIKPGQFVAIVGPSGSGKSTLFRLLLGFETPESGSIYYNNQNLAGVDLQAVRRQIGVVLQNSKLMSGDIYENIVGSAPYTVEDAWEAAKMAGLAEDIKAMPMNLFTVVSEGGSTLSGGQRQRLMIARAIIGKPRILYFDEATSALDNQTQAVVSKSLESLRATRVVIAHRLSTIVNADCIYVLQGGKLVQSGTYNELINQKGPFKELASRQLA